MELPAAPQTCFKIIPAWLKHKQWEMEDQVHYSKAGAATRNMLKSWESHPYLGWDSQYSRGEEQEEQADFWSSHPKNLTR